MVIPDSHVHSEFSFDSQAPIEASVVRAIARGITHITFTDHFEPFIGSPDYPEFDAEGFFRSIHKAKEKYADKVEILAGVEVGQANFFSESIERLLSSYRFDFVIGSLHYTEGSIDMAFQTYTMANCRSWLEKYFLEAADVAKTGLYDVFGHINYICRYMHRQKIPLNIHDYDDLAQLVLRQIVARGKGLEINVSTLRCKGFTSLPPIEVIKKYRAMGGEIITVGSDSHTAANVGICIKRGISLAERAGFKYIATYKDRKPTFHKIEI